MGMLRISETDLTYVRRLLKAHQVAYEEVNQPVVPPATPGPLTYPFAEHQPFQYDREEK